MNTNQRPRPSIGDPPMPPRRPFPVPPLHRPLKQVRYPVPKPKEQKKPVTVCIAVICKQIGEYRIVLCADTRMDTSYTGSNDNTRKISPLCSGLYGLLAGDWMAARDVHNRVKAEIKSKGIPQSETKLKEVLMRCAKAHKKSALSGTTALELMVAGFIKGVPIICVLSIQDAASDPSVQFWPAYKAIGSGAIIAEVFLNLRDCSPHDGIDKALYVVYEAKKYSEKSVGVGPETRMRIIGPPPPTAEAHQNLSWQVSQELLEGMEEMRSTNGIQKLTELPFGYVPLALSPAAPPDPQPPKADQ